MYFFARKRRDKRPTLYLLPLDCFANLKCNVIATYTHTYAHYRYSKFKSKSFNYVVVINALRMGTQFKSSTIDSQSIRIRRVEPKSMLKINGLINTEKYQNNMLLSEFKVLWCNVFSLQNINKSKIKTTSPEKCSAGSVALAVPLLARCERESEEWMGQQWIHTSDRIDVEIE